jgi:hypothetical protein
MYSSAICATECSDETFHFARNEEASEQDASTTTVDAHQNAGLLVKPQILGFPRLRGVIQPEVEVLQS